MLPIEQLWSDIAAAGEPRLSRRVDASHPLDLYATMISAREPALLLVCDDEPTRPPRYQAVELVRGRREDGRWTLLAVLRVPELRPLFGPLCQDLVDATRALQAGQSAPEAVLVRLARWRRMLETTRAGLLSEEELRGLMGELLFLRDIVLPRMDGESGVRAWQGPFAAPQDFLLPEAAVEVKTLRPGTGEIPIACPEQLECATHPLALAVYTLSPAIGSESTALTPRCLVASLRSMLEAGPDALAEFEARLLAAGFADRDEYDDMRMMPSPPSLFRVAAGFPTLAPDHIPAGVVRVRFSVRLAACEAFRIRDLEDLHGA